MVAQLARRLLTEVDTSAGVRLLGVGVGVGVGTLTDFAQDALFSTGTAGEIPGSDTVASPTPAPAETAIEPAATVWHPGQDVTHDLYGPGWIWGSGLGRVTVRFEGPTTGPGPVRTFAVDDPHLHPADPPDWCVATDLA